LCLFQSAAARFLPGTKSTVGKHYKTVTGTARDASTGQATGKLVRK
jgi:hypothetical protein